jgi:hypothetical protein
MGSSEVVTSGEPYSLAFKAFRDDFFICGNIFLVNEN